MADFWDNPIQTDGFEFVEYAAPDPKALGAIFERMGFHAVARHRHKDVTLYKQGGVNFIVNAEPHSFAQNFARRHGPSVCAMAWRVKDAARAYRMLLERGARPRFLGADTPVPAVVAAAQVSDADAIVLAATRSTAFTAHSQSLRKLARDRAVYLAGRGADEQTVAEIGAIGLPDDPVRAVVFLVGALNEASRDW